MISIRKRENLSGLSSIDLSLGSKKGLVDFNPWKINLKDFDDNC